MRKIIKNLGYRINRSNVQSQSFRDINFDFSIEQINIDAIFDCDAVGVGEENIAYNLSITERSIRDELAHT